MPRKYTFKCPDCGGRVLEEEVSIYYNRVVGSVTTNPWNVLVSADNEPARKIEGNDDIIGYTCKSCGASWDYLEEIQEANGLIEEK